MNNIYKYIFLIFWGVFVFYWILNIKNQRAAYKKADISETLPYKTLWVLAFIFLITPSFLNLGNNILAANSSFFGIIGDLLCGLGLVLCIISRKALAGNWSVNLDLKKGHELVQKGPYAFMRHPIYTGFLLMFLGPVLIMGTIDGCVGFILLFIGCIIRIQKEDKLMLDTFGEKFINYKKNVKSLIPFIF